MTNAQGTLATTSLSHKHTEFPWTTNFLSPRNPFKTSFLFLGRRSLSFGYMYMISQCWEGPPVRRDLASKPELFVPQLLGRGRVPTTMNAPPHLDLSCPQNGPNLTANTASMSQHPPRIWIIQQEILGASHFSVRPKFRAIAAAGGAWTEQCPRPRQ